MSIERKFKRGANANANDRRSHFGRFCFGYKTVRSVNSLDILDFRTWYPTKIHISTCDNHF